ncbi:hypothetical protein D3Z47_12270 [Lachnospiraceae bacterium]|nr:hypothetical protein [Lachnospiraceae bacterium]
MRRTTTQKLQQVITNNLLHITKAEIYNKTTQETETIPNDNFLESFDFLCEAIFSQCIGWYYEKNIKTKDYEIECCRRDGSVDVIITAYFRKSDGVNEEDIDEMLLKIEEEE